MRLRSAPLRHDDSSPDIEFRYCIALSPVPERIAGMMRRVLTRSPQPEEVALLAKFYDAQRARFASGELDAAKFGAKTPEAAAWTALVRSMFNLDEALTKG